MGPPPRQGCQVLPSPRWHPTGAPALLPPQLRPATAALSSAEPVTAGGWRHQLMFGCEACGFRTAGTPGMGPSCPGRPDRHRWGYLWHNVNRGSMGLGVGLTLGLREGNRGTEWTSRLRSRRGRLVWPAPALLQPFQVPGPQMSPVGAPRTLGQVHVAEHPCSPEASLVGLADPHVLE